MTRIRTTCPVCGEVEMGAETILLVVSRETKEGRYEFDCPKCLQRIEKRSDAKITMLLEAAGADIRYVVEDSPLDWSDKGRPNASPLTESDLIQFQRDLEDDEKIARELS